MSTAKKSDSISIGARRKKEVIVVLDFSTFFLPHCAKNVKFSKLWFRWHCELSLTAGRSLLLDVSFKIVGNQFCMVLITNDAAHGKQDGRTVDLSVRV